MSVIAILLFVAFSAYLVTRFGNQVLARDSTSWWLILVFLGVGVLSPGVYRSIAQFLGITLVSNFVFAALMLFLLKVTLEGAIRNTQITRKLRDSVTTMAATSFVAKAKFLGAAGRPRALILLPSYNEALNIERMVGSILAQREELSAKLSWTFCFVDDGSQDETQSQLMRYAPENFVSHPSNFGVSGVLLTGFKVAKLLDCDYVVQCDADGQHPVNQISEMIAAAVKHDADLTVGSRFVSNGVRVGGAYKESTTLMRRLGSIMIRFGLFSFGSTASIGDPTSGFRVYSRKAMSFLVKQMPDDYPEPEIIALCALMRLKLLEVPVTMAPRQGGESSISGRKSAEFMVKVFTALISLRLRCALSTTKLERSRA